MGVSDAWDQAIKRRNGVLGSTYQDEGCEGLNVNGWKVFRFGSSLGLCVLVAIFSLLFVYMVAVSLTMLVPRREFEGVYIIALEEAYYFFYFCHVCWSGCVLKDHAYKRLGSIWPLSGPKLSGRRKSSALFLDHH